MITKYTKLLSASLLAGTVLLAGCSATHSSTTSTYDQTVDLVGEVDQSVSRLISRARLDPSKPLLAVSFADIDDLSTSSTLGRTLGEQYSTAMTSEGLRMIEVKMRDALYIKEGTGELMLSRELRSLVQGYSAQAVLVGTYSQGGSNIYVNSRIVRTNDNIVVSADSMTLPMNRDLRSMLPRR